MAVAVVTCPKCNFRFNYRFIPFVSMSAVRLGTARYFRCPQCHQRAVFDLTVPGPDPTARNYVDPLGWSFAALLAFAIAGPILLVLAPQYIDSVPLVHEFSLVVFVVLVVGLVSIATFTLFRSDLRADPVS